MGHENADTTAKAQLEYAWVFEVFGDIQQMADQLGKTYFVLYRLYRLVADDMGGSLPPKSGRRIPCDKLKEIRKLLLTTNLTIVEIAEKLGVTEGTSKSNLSDARAILQKKIQHTLTGKVHL